jgi:hypothetical protein
MVFGLDSPSRNEVHSPIVGGRTSDEELDINLARLTPTHQDQFRVLVRIMESRYVEPQRLRTITASRPLPLPSLIRQIE